MWDATVWRMMVLAACGVGAVACASLKDASAGQVGCKPDDIEISDDSVGFGSHTWTATCRDRSYSCAYVQTVGGSGGQVNCSPMDDDRRWAAPSRPAASSGGERPAAKAKVERAFDEQRELHIVRGSFSLAPGLQANLVGVPQVALGTIAVVLAGNVSNRRFAECAGVEVLINAQPFASQENATRRPAHGFDIESRFDFQIFRPLTQQFATFGIRACGHQWSFNDAQLGELQKFFVIYSQVAMQVQAGELPSKADTAAASQSSQPPEEAPAPGAEL
jgi:hypothetical protein